MSREILFRGKSKDNGKWVEGFFCGRSILTKDNEESKWVGEEAYTWDEVFIRTLGQFTGLLDCEGTKIFEGDVVETTETVWVGASREREVKVRGVCLLNGAFRLGVSDLLSNYTRFLDDSALKVIGNVHDQEKEQS